MGSWSLVKGIEVSRADVTFTVMLSLSERISGGISGTHNALWYLEPVVSLIAKQYGNISYGPVISAFCSNHT